MDPTDDPVPFNPLHLRATYEDISLTDAAAKEAPKEAEPQSLEETGGGQATEGVVEEEYIHADSQESFTKYDVVSEPRDTSRKPANHVCSWMQWSCLGCPDSEFAKYYRGGFSLPGQQHEENQSKDSTTEDSNTDVSSLDLNGDSEGESDLNDDDSEQESGGDSTYSSDKDSAYCSGTSEDSTEADRDVSEKGDTRDVGDHTIKPLGGLDGQDDDDNGNHQTSLKDEEASGATDEAKFDLEEGEIFEGDSTGSPLDAEIKHEGIAGNEEEAEKTEKPGEEDDEDIFDEMAAQRNERNVHQDYIVRQRYENSLPPPPGLPKLLDIPINALDQYTSPVYASRMVRSQQLNIEADAFLGMDIDLVGMPGVFDGDESAIQAPMVTPPVHPKDKALLRPLKSLGKPKGEEEDISFLRRTQYTAEERNRIDAARASVTPNIKKKRPDANKEDPKDIKRSVIKGFDIANPQSAYKGPDTPTQTRGHAPTAAELDAWNNPKHPTNPNAYPVDFYPIFPAVDSMPDDGGYVLIQLKGQPTDVTDKYDKRMDAALLRPDLDNVPEPTEEVQAKMAAHKADPVHNEHPLLSYNYSMFLPEDAESAEKFQEKFDPKNSEREDPALYTAKSDEAKGENDCFRYNFVRDYETTHIVDNRQNPYQEVVMALHDGDPEKGIQKGAYMYPIQQRIQMKAKRHVAIPQMGATARPEDPEARIDRVHVTVREPNEDEIEMREAHKKKLEPEDDDTA